MAKPRRHGLLRAGADDYIAKPFHPEELQARINAAVRIVTLQTELSQRVEELEKALQRVRVLEGMLPICSYCKKVRDDRQHWEDVDTYVMKHSKAKFSHGICPDCFRSKVEPGLA